MDFFYGLEFIEGGLIRFYQFLFLDYYLNKCLCFVVFFRLIVERKFIFIFLMIDEWMEILLEMGLSKVSFEFENMIYMYLLFL